MSLIVHRPGLLTTVQDLGRWGHQSAGVPVTGPMDAWSHRLANLAIGNAADAAVLEVTVTGPLIACEADALIAITGAPFAIRVGEQQLRSPLLLQVPAGTSVEFGECLAGTRAYVAVEGGLDVPVVLGSRSTDLRGGFGGYGGRAVRAGDRLAWTRAAPDRGAPRRSRAARHATGSAAVYTQQVPETGIAPARHELTRLRVVRGPADGPSAERAFTELLGRSFRVSSQSDRMGYRLEGDPIGAGATAALITGPTTMGLVQVPPSGEPILLMADRQTTGGYTAVAVVITADVPVAGQLGPGHTVAFETCTYEEARSALAAREAQLTAIEAALW